MCGETIGWKLLNVIRIQEGFYCLRCKDGYPITFLLVALTKRAVAEMTQRHRWILISQCLAVGYNTLWVNGSLHGFEWVIQGHCFSFQIQKVEWEVDHWSVQVQQPYKKSWLTGKDHGVGKDEGQEKKRVTENEMVEWHHRLKGHAFEQTPGDSEGLGSPVVLQSMRS